MKIGTENLHLILTEELYKVDEIDKTGSTNQIIPPEPGQSEELPLETKEVSLSPGLQVITEPLTHCLENTLKYDANKRVKPFAFHQPQLAHYVRVREQYISTPYPLLHPTFFLTIQQPLFYALLNLWPTLTDETLRRFGTM